MESLRRAGSCEPDDLPGRRRPGNGFGKPNGVERLVDGTWYLFVGAIMVGLLAAAFRRNWPALALLVVLGAGALLALALGMVKPIPSLGLSTLEPVMPAWDIQRMLSSGGFSPLRIPCMLIRP